MMIDLFSKAGSKVNDQAIKEGIPVSLKSGDKLQFAASSRTYHVEVDYSKIA